MYVDYSYDTREHRCDVSEDFLCQCTGMASHGFFEGENPDIARNLRTECIEGLLEHH